MTSLIRLKHTAPYSWFAEGSDIAGRKALDDAAVPILRVRKGENFEPRTGLYYDTIEISRAVDQPDWWMKAGSGMDAWRADLSPGKICALRFFKDDGTKNGGTGDWLGIYRIVSAQITGEAIRIALDPKRIWNVRQ